ncbi:MAG TPA: hypothetical protein VF188_08190 [Longimicrobiales bacterium]
MRSPKALRATAAPPVAALALALAACGADAPRPLTVERADSAGIELVTTRGPDVPLAWRFTPLLTLGGAAEGPESFYSLAPTYVDADSAGNLYVLDRDNHRVVVFDSAGGVVRLLGREGGGPGEVEWPFNLSVAPDGTVSVWDMGKHGLVRWAPDGSVLETRALPIPYFGPTLRVTALGVVFYDFTAPADTDHGRARVLLWRDGETTEIASLATPPPRMATFPSCGVSFRTGPVFAPTLEWDARGRMVAVGPGPDYVVDVYRDGKRTRSIRRAVPLRAATEAMALKALGEGMSVGLDTGECTIPAEEVVRARGVAPVIPAVDAVAIAPDGGIWVRRGFVQGEAAAVDVFGADGAYLGTLPVGAPFPALFLPGGRVAAIVTDDLDVDRLVVYRVEREAG